MDAHLIRAVRRSLRSVARARLHPRAYLLVAAYAAGLYALSLLLAAALADVHGDWTEVAAAGLLYPAAVMVLVGWVVVAALQLVARPARASVQATIGAATGLVVVALALAFTM